ncbi:hypothetical protein SLE2022_385420 [Rubroshorea leprosula]
MYLLSGLLKKLRSFQELRDVDCSTVIAKLSIPPAIRSCCSAISKISYINKTNKYANTAALLACEGEKGGPTTAFTAPSKLKKKRKNRYFLVGSGSL